MDETLTFRLERVVQAPQEVMEDFEGPLDLILYLLGKNKIAIADLRISLLCEQFLAWIEARRELDIEVASEFIEMASHLVYLKSRNLLTSGEEEIDLFKKALEDRQAQEDRQKMELIRDYLGQRAENYRLLMTKPPEPTERSKEYGYIHTVDILLAAIARLSERSERRRPPPVTIFTPIVGREPYPVKDMMEFIAKQVAMRGKIPLDELFLFARSRSAVVAAFLAVLEMCRNREIDLVEEETWRIWKPR
jgi:segregation and condensation protein A